jgi:hypothetical protein
MRGTPGKSVMAAVMRGAKSYCEAGCCAGTFERAKTIVEFAPELVRSVAEGRARFPASYAEALRRKRAAGVDKRYKGAYK